jgi:hypothetical protein
MRQPWSRRATIAIVLATSGLLALIWWFRPRVYDTVRQADRLTLYEGLPHPNYEKRAFQEELKSESGHDNRERFEQDKLDFAAGYRSVPHHGRGTERYRSDGQCRPCQP